MPVILLPPIDSTSITPPTGVGLMHLNQQVGTHPFKIWKSININKYTAKQQTHRQIDNNWSCSYSLRYFFPFDQLKFSLVRKF
jgi:hypothetical protein